MLKYILSKFNRKFDWQRTCFEQTDQWKKLKVGDIVECAVQFNEGIRYKIEHIDQAEQKATIQRIDQGGNEAYTLALVMLRPAAQS